MSEARKLDLLFIITITISLIIFTASFGVFSTTSSEEIINNKVEQIQNWDKVFNN